MAAPSSSIRLTLDQDSVSLCDVTRGNVDVTAGTLHGKWRSERILPAHVRHSHAITGDHMLLSNHHQALHPCHGGLPTVKTGPLHLQTSSVTRHRIHLTPAHSLGNIYIGSAPSLTNAQVTCGAHYGDAGGGRVSSRTLTLDSGWSWAILAASFVMYCTLGFQFGCFSVIYVELVDYFAADRGKIGWIGSLFPAVGNFSAVVMGPLVLRVGARTMTMMGACLGSLGLGLSSLLISVPYMYLTYGVLGGIGMGAVMMGTLVTLQLYFDKRRPLANGIGSVGISAGQLIAGPVTQIVVDQLGLTGALLLCSGIFLQNFVAGALLRPLECDVFESCSNSSSDQATRTSSESSLKKYTCPFRVTNFFTDIFDLTILKNGQFAMLIFGTFLSVFGCESFFGHYISRAVYHGISVRTASILQTVLAFCMAVGRGCTACYANLPHVDRLMLYGVTILLSGVVVALFILTSTIAGFIAFGIVQGLLTGCFYSIQATVLVDLLGVTVFPRAQGFSAVAIGLAFCLSIPLAGSLVDLSHSYEVPYIVCGSLQAVGGIVLVALAVLRRKSTPDVAAVVHGSLPCKEAYINSQPAC